ncbi:MAG: ATP-dependent helicase, partial [Candidatus Diapherotrites archaeon]|nr:ATP-dependent helicase [Candidatus Diapherotrites archaeon]
TTPESLAIVLNSPKFSQFLHDVKWCVIDEIHALASNKRGVHLSLSLERLQRLSKDMCRIGLSATIAPLEEIAKFLVGKKNDKEFRDCDIVDVRFIKKVDLQVLSPLPDLVNVSQEQIHDTLYSVLHELIQRHRTTLIFTNTRSATERVVHYLKEKFPKHYLGVIGAHHSSLDRSLRLKIEEKLKEGKLKVVVSSTSLELGIDIGYIDLVVLVGSPKSISRALQRCGRAGHRLHDVVKGRIIVLDRDDLVECAILTREALRGNLDLVTVPKNALDVLAQHIYGIAISERIHVDELFRLIRKSYCYENLSREDFNNVISYLAGEYASLEERKIFAKIWYDEKTGYIGRRSRLARVIYMTNVGTIPDEARVKVKIGPHVIGTIDEPFLERLRKGDVFVLGGETYEFLYSRGMTAQVRPASKRPPTVPSWISEMLPLSFELALAIQHFRKLMAERFKYKEPKEKIIEFIHRYLSVDIKAARAIYNYFSDQYSYAVIPHENLLLIEQFEDEFGKHAVFHTLYGRRVNDALSLCFAYLIGRLIHKDVLISITDNGFMLTAEKLPIDKAFNLLKVNKLDTILNIAIEKTEAFVRRFRHCAVRSLMILRNYMGRKKTVSRQQMNAKMMLSAVKRISNDFPILKETRRELLEDYMDIRNAEKVVEWINSGKLKIVKLNLPYPSPFAFNIVASGRSDLVRMESKLEFIRRMHAKVKQYIGNKKKLRGENIAR